MNKKIIGFGEIMMRLTPTNHCLIKDSELYHVYYGGSETNVLITLSSLGLKTDYVSVIPENSIGEGAIRHLTKNNVDISNVVRKGDHLGIYFVEEGFGERPSNVIYNRDNSAIRDIDASDINAEKIFNGANAYFTSGISLALSTKTSDVAVDLAKKAKEMGLTVIFDFNYRSKLWSIEEAKEKFKEIIPYADVCFGNLFDSALLQQIGDDGGVTVGNLVVGFLVAVGGMVTGQVNIVLNDDGDTEENAGGGAVGQSLVSLACYLQCIVAKGDEAFIWAVIGLDPL